MNAMQTVAPGSPPDRVHTSVFGGFATHAPNRRPGPRLSPPRAGKPGPSLGSFGGFSG